MEGITHTHTHTHMARAVFWDLENIKLPENEERAFAIINALFGPGGFLA